MWEVVSSRENYYLEQRPLSGTILKGDQNLEIDGLGGAYRRKFESILAKEVECQTQAKPLKLIANVGKRVCRPSENKLNEVAADASVFGTRMETGSENCSSQKLSEEGDVLTEATCGCDSWKLDLMGVEEHESSLFRGNKVQHLESNSVENKSLYHPTKAMTAFFLESENFSLTEESDYPNSVHYRVDLDRIKVKKALNLFDDIYRKLLQQLKANPKSERKNTGHTPVEAAMIAKQQLKWFNTKERALGAVAGTNVGDQFRFRAQLALIGLHCQYMSGIDYVEKDGKIIATSIVDSGRYAYKEASDYYLTETACPDVFSYLGQGGKPQVPCGSCTREPEDQKLEGGNLALKNSMEARTPVRVIRKFQSSLASVHNRSGKVPLFRYDGLYVVNSCTQQRGPYERLIFKFQLSRIDWQPEFTKCLVSESTKLKMHCDFIVDDDISQGKEMMPIRAVNTLDNETPGPFKYVTEMVCPEELDSLPSCSGCDCVNGCLDFEPCSCLNKNGGGIPFNENGAILRVKSIVHECGPSCKCPPSCKNRVSQHGVRYQLEIFKTERKGWGVRSQDFIASGSFICEYAGELLSEKEAENRIDNDEYLFDIGNNYDSHVALDKSLGRPHSQSRFSFSKPINDCGFTIDAAEYGNVGRFVNHSCSPNLYAQDVLYDHDDIRRPHVMLFASENIPPLRELTFDYNYKIGQVRDANGNIKKKMCCCGAHNCVGRMY